MGHLSDLPNELLLKITTLVVSNDTVTSLSWQPRWNLAKFSRWSRTTYVSGRGWVWIPLDREGNAVWYKALPNVFFCGALALANVCRKIRKCMPPVIKNHLHIVCNEMHGVIEDMQPFEYRYLRLGPARHLHHKAWEAFYFLRLSKCFASTLDEELRTKIFELGQSLWKMTDHARSEAFSDVTYSPAERMSDSSSTRLELALELASFMEVELGCHECTHSSKELSTMWGML